MTNDQQAEMNMFDGFDAELTADSTVFSGNPKMVTKVGVFRAALAENKACANSAHPNNSGYSQLKKDKKLAVSETASILTGQAHVALTDLGKGEIARLLHINPTDYSSASDSECGSLLQSAYDIMFANKADLCPDTFELQELTDFQTEITEFVTAKGVSEWVHDVSPTLTKAFEESFVPVRKAIEQLKLMARKYKKTNKPFYARFMASTIISAVNVHHTFVDIIVLDKVTGNPLEGIQLTLTKGKKSGLTDYQGKLSIERVMNGKDVVTGTYKGKVVCEEHIEIIKGKRNGFEFLLTIVED